MKHRENTLYVDNLTQSDRADISREARRSAQARPGALWPAGAPVLAARQPHPETAMPIDQNDPVHARIQQLIDTHDVVLFMKGDPAMPQCGFSASAVDELRTIGVDFADAAVTTVNVLEQLDIRQGIKSFSDWPTIPQLYVKQEFVGGSDIIRQSAASGELHGMLGIAFTPPKAPEITVTDAMKAAVAGAEGEGPTALRLVVGAGFRYQIGFDEQKPGDFVVASNGIQILVDASSARKADGITLDFEDGPQGGVVIDNPNEPPKVRQLSVQGLQKMLAEGADIRLFDVRSDEERATALLSDKAEQLTPEKAAEVEAIADKSTVLVFHCHHGGRSQQAASYFLSKGFRKVYNVEGGIDAWSMFVDPTVPRY